MCQSVTGVEATSADLSQSGGDVRKLGAGDVNLTNMATLESEYGDWKYERF